MITILEKIETKKATISLLEDRIICLEFRSNVEFKVSDAKLVNKAFTELAKEEPFCSLVDGRNTFGIISKEAREHFAENKALSKQRLAEALIIDNLANRFLANFYITFNRSNNPCKVFTDYDAAIDWLRTFTSLH